MCYAVTADAAINKTAKSDRNTMFFLPEDLGGLRREEPPGSEGPNLPYSIVMFRERIKGKERDIVVMCT